MRKLCPIIRPYRTEQGHTCCALKTHPDIFAGLLKSFELNTEGLALFFFMRASRTHMDGDTAHVPTTSAQLEHTIRLRIRIANPCISCIDKRFRFQDPGTDLGNLCYARRTTTQTRL